MRPLTALLVILAAAAGTRAQDVRRDVPYADKADEKRVKGFVKELTPETWEHYDPKNWTEKDEEGARRIKRTWRRMFLDFAPDDQAAVVGQVRAMVRELARHRPLP